MARSSSRGAISARAIISSTVRRFSSRRPPLITSDSFALAKSFSTLAMDTESPAEPSGRSPTKAIAVGPVRRSSRSRPNSSTATRTRVFLYTLYSPPASRSALRSSAMAGTSRPRYSVRIAVSLADSFSRTSSTTATFSDRGSPTLTPPHSSSRSAVDAAAGLCGCHRPKPATRTGDQGRANPAPIRRTPLLGRYLRRDPWI